MTDPRLPRVLIVYYSRFGAVRGLAERIAEGARRVPGVEVDFYEVADEPIDAVRPGEGEAEMRARRQAVGRRLEVADALIVGAPSYFGSMASPVKRLFEACLTAPEPDLTDASRPWRHELFRDKVASAFTASGTPHGGNEQTLLSILTLCIHLGMIVVTPGQGMPILVNEGSPYGATTIAGPTGDRPPTEAEQAAARALGERVATVATWLRLGRAELTRHGLPGTHPTRFDPSA